MNIRKDIAIITVLSLFLTVVIMNYDIFSANTDFNFFMPLLLGLIVLSIRNVYHNMNSGVLGGVLGGGSGSFENDYFTITGGEIVKSISESVLGGAVKKKTTAAKDKKTKAPAKKKLKNDADTDAASDASDATSDISDASETSDANSEILDRAARFSDIDPAEKIKAPDDKNAYVWLLMDVSELPRVITSIFSVHRTTPKYDLVLMVTDDINAKSRSVLEKLIEKKCLTKIVDVQRLGIKSTDLKPNAELKGDLFAPWSTDEFTRWNCMTLVEYSKILFLGNNTITLGNMDHLFRLRAPAASFVNPAFANNSSGKYAAIIRGTTDADGFFEHGSKIHANGVRIMLGHGNSKEKAVAFSSSMLLLSPSKKDYDLFIKAVNESKNEKFGFLNVYAGAFEQALCFFYSIVKRFHWANISQRYNFMKDFMKPGELYTTHSFPYMLCFVSDSCEKAGVWKVMAAEASQQLELKGGDVKMPLSGDDDLTSELFGGNLPSGVTNCLDLMNILEPTVPLYIQTEPFNKENSHKAAGFKRAAPGESKKRLFFGAPLDAAPRPRESASQSKKIDLENERGAISLDELRSSSKNKGTHL